MKPQAAIVALTHLTSRRRPGMMWGPPGVGKSSVNAQVADKLFTPTAKQERTLRKRGGDAVGRVVMDEGRPYFIDLRLPLLDAVDLRGIPMERGGRTAWLTPSFLPTEGSGIIFLDELPQALPIVQSAASQLILDGRIGEYVLPKGWTVHDAGNREEDRAATHKMPSHIANRFVHINLEVDYDDWVAWAVTAGINPMIIYFLGFRPEYLHKFDKNAKANPTPRTWEFASQILVDMPDDAGLLLELMNGTVGEAAAKEFVGFMRVFRELPDYDEVIKRPDEVRVPQNAAGAYATGSMLAQRAQAKDMKPIARYLARFPEEFEVMTMLKMTKARKELAETGTYIQWASDHQNVLLNKAP